MPDLQTEKSVVRALNAALMEEGESADALARFTRPGYRWRGFHPFGELTGSDAVASDFWDPLRRSLTCLQRREDIFFAGRNQMDGFESTWVASMGHLMGLFDAAWLGIGPTGKMAFLRYCEFHRVEGDKIAETAMYFDIPHLMRQAGLIPFPHQAAAHLVQPGPQTHDGLLHDSQPEEPGHQTLDLINRMIADIGRWDSGLSLEEELRRTWAEDMIWWGPEGIGATYTIPRYAAQHARPFRASFSKRSQTSHIARIAEGHYGGFFGWPNFTARPTGGLLGLQASDTESEFRVIDIYRRDGEKLAENWIFIDVLHALKCQGVDLLGEERSGIAQ